MCVCVSVYSTRVYIYRRRASTALPPALFSLPLSLAPYAAPPLIHGLPLDSHLLVVLVFSTILMLAAVLSLLTASLLSITMSVCVICHIQQRGTVYQGLHPRGSGKNK